MLESLREFRRKLDEIMVQCIHNRTVLYGYGRTGQFLEWYADYYHSIKVDYIVREKTDEGIIPYSFSTYAPTVFDFDYKDVRDAVVWIAFTDSGAAKNRLEQLGYKAGKTYFDFIELIYGEDKVWETEKAGNAVEQRKQGNRDIQFLEYLEYKYECNFVTRVEIQELSAGDKVTYVVSAMREIFEILNRCHCIPRPDDAIFDMGAGKGAALLSFLDYGFSNIGGVELDENLFGILSDNFQKLAIDVRNEGKIELFQGSVFDITDVLDRYNWFYFFMGSAEELYEKCFRNIADSIERKPRKVTIIIRNPSSYKIADKYGFILINQFDINTRQRVTNIYTNEL